jgi:ABC-type branched-subunit amino acid transport system substrate-binding protein
LPIAAAVPPGPLVAGLPAEQALVLGERMYREGRLPDGKPMKAELQGRPATPGTSFACASCHQRGGLGGPDDGFITLAVNARKLFEPLYRKWPKIPPSEREHYGLVAPPSRPAYTDATLAAAIRTGVDPAGRALSPVMPRFPLKTRDMEILVHYLKHLNAEVSPGVTATTLTFATVLTEEVSAADREAMLLPLDNFIRSHNATAANMDTKMYWYPAGAEMMLSYRKFNLLRWELKGPRETWAAQLEAYQRQEPVFALLGGITYGDWEPIHAFCEAQRLPCLFPITDYPVVSSKDWYTLYFSKGLTQEGQAAAYFLGSQPEQGTVLQVVQDTRQGRALAAGFTAAWDESGHQPARTVVLPEGTSLAGLHLRDLAKGEPIKAMVVWAGPEVFPALQEAAETPGTPGLFVVSAGYLKQALWDLPEAARSATRITYPWRAPEEEPKYSRYANALLAGIKDHHPETRISTRTYSLIAVLQKSFMDLDQNFYRDTLLDVLGMLPDQTLADYERLAFGPGLRYASQGCYVMQLPPGPSKTLIKKSAWLLP